MRLHYFLIQVYRPDLGVEIKLYDDDRGIDTDDLMAQTETDSEGHFQINIYHDCEDGIKVISLLFSAAKLTSLALPTQTIDNVARFDKYVSSGENPERIYDLGVLELSGGFKGETRDCIH
ncbi:transthyretin-like protein 5 [Ditylenchus destructor]|uniref:Transthyretin-like protein 5 n=1 Tax=Ditylenchus destructor TaxID=166010 RepID=A0AAD4MV32_9BILA|nr:transthyretin-like protein 5 [Ditylenchus destructor]